MKPNAIVPTWKKKQGGLIYLKKLGEGFFGEAHLVSFRGQLSVVKRVIDCNIDEFDRELYAMEDVRGEGGAPRVVASASECDSPVLVMSYCPGRTLASMQDEHLSLAQWLQVFVAVTESLVRVHARGVIHNDIHGRNIIINEPRPGHYTAAIIDFGQAQPRQSSASPTNSVFSHSSFKEFFVVDDFFPAVHNDQSDVRYVANLMQLTCLSLNPPSALKALLSQATHRDWEKRPSMVSFTSQIKQILQDHT